MKKFIIFVVFVIAAFYLAADFVKSGKLQKFIDDHSDKSWAPKVQYELGAIYQTASNRDSAEFCFNRVLEKYTSSQFTVDAMYNLGVIYEDTNRAPQAREIYKKILEEHPDYENKKTVEGRLNFMNN